MRRVGTGLNCDIAPAILASKEWSHFTWVGYRSVRKKKKFWHPELQKWIPGQYTEIVWQIQAPNCRSDVYVYNIKKHQQKTGRI